MRKLTRNYLKLLNEIINIKNPFDTEIIGNIHYDRCYPFLMLSNHTKQAKYNCVINSGAHGEEAQTIDILIRFLQEFNTEYLSSYNFHIFPIINPFGYSYNCRKNGNNKYGNTGFIQKIPARLTEEAILIGNNIPRKIDIFIDIHSDNKNGFYLYERKRPNKPSLGGVCLDELRKNKIPILENETVYKEKCKDGIIIAPERDGSMDDSMFSRGVIYSICVEIPRKIPDDQQLIGGLMLINSLLKNFRETK